MKTTFTTLLVGKKGRISGHTSVSTVSDIQKCLPNFSPENKGKAELIQAALLSGKKTPKWTSLFFSIWSSNSHSIPNRTQQGQRQN
jgi:hypothetical protein